MQRVFLYCLGLVVLAVGLTLNTKTGLGVAPAISVAFAVSTVWNANFAMMVFAIYSLFVVLQFLLTSGNRSWKIILQIPFNVVFTFLLNIFGKLLPLNCTALWQQLALLIVAIVFTAVGIALTVSMQIIPNPADGLAQVLGSIAGKDTGFGKNLVDISCVVMTCVLMLATGQCDNAVGIGTLITMIGVGRVISLFYHFFEVRLDQIVPQNM